MKIRIALYITLFICFGITLFFVNAITDDISAGISGFLLYAMVILSRYLIKQFFPSEIQYHGLFLISLIILFIPYNLSIGMYITNNGIIRYYGGFPRYYIMWYLLIVYILLFSLSVIFNKKSENYNKNLFLNSDILYISLFTAAWIASIFVFPIQ